MINQASNLQANYKRLKEDVLAEKIAENVQVLLINGTPALRVKTHDSVTLKYLGDVEEGVDVPALKKQVEALQTTIANYNELIADAEALTDG